MSLTDTKIRSAKPREKSYKLYDEKGLYLQVNPNGSKPTPDPATGARSGLGTDRP